MASVSSAFQNPGKTGAVMQGQGRSRYDPVRVPLSFLLDSAGGWRHRCFLLGVLSRFPTVGCTVKRLFEEFAIVERAYFRRDWIFRS